MLKMMLDFNSELIEGEIEQIIETYTNESTGDGYDILKVSGNIVIKTNGIFYIPGEIEDGQITSWNSVTENTLYTEK